MVLPVTWWRIWNGIAGFLVVKWHFWGVEVWSFCLLFWVLIVGLCGLMGWCMTFGGFCRFVGRAMS